MSGDDFGRLAYLVLLLIAVGGWFVAEARTNIGKSVRQALVWGLIFLGVIAGFGLWQDIRDDLAPRQSYSETGEVIVPLGPDGHYHLDLVMNGTIVSFVVDTGASDIVLSREDARRVGIDPDALAFTGRANTANGMVTTAPARVARTQLGEIVDENLRVSVNGGELDKSLLGMAYLRRFDRIEIRDNRLILSR